MEWRERKKETKSDKIEWKCVRMCDENSMKRHLSSLFTYMAFVANVNRLSNLLAYTDQKLYSFHLNFCVQCLQNKFQLKIIWEGWLNLNAH